MVWVVLLLAQLDLNVFEDCCGALLQTVCIVSVHVQRQTNAIHLADCSKTIETDLSRVGTYIKPV